MTRKSLSEYEILLRYSQGKLRWREAAKELCIFGYEEFDTLLKKYQLLHPNPDALPKEEV